MIHNLSFSQVTNIPDTGPIEYELIDSIAKDKFQLYDQMKIWIASNFKSSKNVIQSEDREAGFIICKGNIDYQLQYEIVDEAGKRGNKKATSSSQIVKGNCDFTLKFYCRDQKIKLVVSDVYLPFDEYYGTILGKTEKELSWDKKYRSMVFESEEGKELKPMTNNLKARIEALDQLFHNFLKQISSSLHGKSDLDF